MHRIRRTGELHYFLQRPALLAVGEMLKVLNAGRFPESLSARLSQSFGAIELRQISIECA